MREIKFRAWDNEKGQYYTPTYEAYLGKLEYLSISMGTGRLMMTTMKGQVDESIFPDRFIIEQYTGLKDKNGKEIYEGDKVRAIDTNTRDYVDEVEDVVAYIGSCFSLSESWETLDFFGGKNLEVIGNIHENQELLK